MTVPLSLRRRELRGRWKTDYMNRFDSPLGERKDTHTSRTHGSAIRALKSKAFRLLATCATAGATLAPAAGPAQAATWNTGRSTSGSVDILSVLR